MTHSDVSRCALSITAAMRAHGFNREAYITQSQGVAFGLLPERQADLEWLARKIRGNWNRHRSRRGARPVQ